MDKRDTWAKYGILKQAISDLQKEAAEERRIGKDQQCRIHLERIQELERAMEDYRQRWLQAVKAYEDLKAQVKTFMGSVKV